MPLKNKSLLTEIRRLWHFIPAPHRVRLGLSFVLMLITAFAEMASVAVIFPFLQALGDAEAMLVEATWQPLFKSLGIGSAQGLVVFLTACFVGVVVATNALRYLNLRVQLRFSADLGSEISAQAFRNTLAQPYRFHVGKNSSDLIQIVSTDSSNLVSALQAFLLAVSNFMLIPAIAAPIVLMDAKVAVLSVVVLGSVYGIIYRIRNQSLQKNSLLIAESGMARIKIVQEGLGGIRDVLLNDLYSYFNRAFERAVSALNKSLAQNETTYVSPIYLIETLAFVAIGLLVLGIGSGGDFSRAVPVLGALAMGAKRLLPALQHAFGSVSRIQGTRVSLQRVLEALALPIGPALAPNKAVPCGMAKELRLEGVWFRYSEDLDWVLKGLDLHLQANTTTALIGTTGCGKSTTADLILGLLSPQEGRILADGVPLEGERLRQWQAAVAHVPQHIFLSDATLLENIAFGIPPDEIDFPKVQQAARLAQIEGFIEDLPEKYHTSVGERGIRLSGGQRQRIGIARALYKNASVIVFDEATSALDQATEKEVMAAIEGLNGKMTVVLIAHRLSTVKHADTIVELGNGRVKKNYVYSELAKG
jgi:ATP-binding cassette subfamily B protein